MKTRIIILALASLALSGCSTVNKLIKKTDKTIGLMEQYQIEEVDVPGRYTNTNYKDDGERITVTHGNPLLQSGEKIKIVKKKKTTNP